MLFVPSGNAQTLKHEPKEKQINTYERLRDFWKRFYSAHYMTLAVQSRGTRHCHDLTESPDEDAARLNTPVCYDTSDLSVCLTFLPE